MIYSIQKIVNQFEVIAASHSEIKSFGYGASFDIDKIKQENDLFPQLWVEPVNTQIILNRNSGQDQRRFIIYCYDLIRQDEENMISVWNTTELILIDICRIFAYSSINYKIVNNPILTPFQEKYGDNVTGYFCEIVIETPQITGTCDIPTN